MLVAAEVHDGHGVGFSMAAIGTESPRQRSTNRDESLPLEGLRVLDVATLIAGPLTATILADFGADVIKIEHPRGDPLRSFGHLKEGASLYWKFLGRNKRAITVNLSIPEGQQIFKTLAKTADVVIENFQPGTLERWNVGYDELSRLNPRLIMLRTTGFGQTGPYRYRPGFGTIAEAMSGFAHINGMPDGPPILPSFAMADGVAAMCGAYAIMFAIYHRDVRGTGQGQYIDLSLYEALTAILGVQSIEHDALGIVQGRAGSRLLWTAPRNTYRTKDGRWVALSASAQPIAERVFNLIGRPELINDPRFKTNKDRVQHIDEVDEIVGSWIGEHDYEAVIKRFEEYQAAIGPVYDISDLLDDPHVKARASFVRVQDPEIGSVRMLSPTPKLSRTPGKIRYSGPKLGEHNEEIYIKELGYSKSDLERLKSGGIV